MTNKINELLQPRPAAHLAVVFVIGFLVGYGAGVIVPLFRQRMPGRASAFEGRIVLVEKRQDGSVRETGIRVPYDVTGAYSGAASLRLSPDRTRVVFSEWVGARVELYVADVEGSNVKRIAAQTVPEGSGGIDTSTIRWSDDGTRVMYSESGRAYCPKTYCASPDDFIQGPDVTYSVDVITGEKSIVPDGASS